ncbi:MAG: hypothetical protein AB1938_26585 [Myxococcota bacterium]
MQARKLVLPLLSSFALLACGGGSTSAWVGTWDATYAGTYSLNPPPQPTQSNSASGVFTISESGSTITIGIALSGETTGNCSATLATTGNTAAYAPPTQNCSFTVAATGAQQTNTNGGTATLSGDTLTLTVVSGTFAGTVAGVPYSGTYNGTWTAIRRPTR